MEKDEEREQIKKQEKDVDAYSETGREELVDSGEMDSWEAGYMEGAEDDGQLAKDALTGEPLTDMDKVYETKIDGKKYRFVSEENLIKFREQKEE